VLGLIRSSVAALAALVIAGCSSGASSLPRVTPQNAAPHGTATAAAASFVIKIPQDSANVQGARRTSYVSPATQSIQITVSPGPAQINVEADLTPTNPHCTVPQAISYLTCSVPLALAAGTYSANFVTYDKPGGAGGTGRKLSETDGVAFTVSGNGGDQIGVTLGGIPAALSVTAAPASAGRVIVPAGFAQIGIAGRRPQSLAVDVLDADGNVIVGPGSAPISVTSSDPSVISVTPPTAQQPGTIPVRVVKFSAAPITLSFTATPPSSSNAGPVTLALTTQTLPELFVTDTGAHVRAYADVQGVAVPVPADDITVSGAQIPNVDITAANAKGEILALDFGNNVVKTYSPGTPGVIAGTKIRYSASDFVNGIAVDAAGSVYLFDQSAETISAYAPGNSTPNWTIPTGFGGVAGFTYDAQRNALWLGTGTAVVGYDVQLRAHLGADTIPNFSNVGGIAVDGNDDVWVWDTRGPQITAWHKQNGAWTQIAEDTIPLSTLNGAGALAIDPFGLVWTAETFTLGGTTTLQSFRPGQSSPVANTSDPRIGEALGITIVP
jgi:hypothetical protein